MTEEAKTIAYTLLHQQLVARELLGLAHKLEMRATTHDLSKFSAEEFEGLVEINHIAREQGFGSQAYQLSLQSQMVKHHWANNDHHPEHFEEFEQVGISIMGLVQIIEMICDWKAVAIQKKLNFWEVYEENCKRFKVTIPQRYLMDCIVQELLT